MKKLRPVRLIVILTALSSLTRAVPPAELPPADALMPLSTRPLVSHGMSPEHVAAIIGPPSFELAKNIWAFLDFKAVGASKESKHDALIVVFTNNQVSRIRLVQSQSVHAFIARRQKIGAAAVVASSELPK